MKNEKVFSNFCKGNKDNKICNYKITIDNDDAPKGGLYCPFCGKRIPLSWFSREEQSDSVAEFKLIEPKPKNIDELFEELGIEMEIFTNGDVNEDVSVRYKNLDFEETLHRRTMKFGKLKPKKLTRDDVLKRLREIADGEVVPIALEDELFNVQPVHKPQAFKCGDMEFAVKKHYRRKYNICISEIDGIDILDISPECGGHLALPENIPEGMDYDVLTNEEWLEVCIAFLTAKKQDDE
jgi:hypothetical protein